MKSHTNKSLSKNMIRILLFAAIFCILCFELKSFAAGSDEEWSIICFSDLTPEVQSLIDPKEHHPGCIINDFDLNGLQDLAVLRKSEENQLELLVTLSLKEGRKIARIPLGVFYGIQTISLVYKLGHFPNLQFVNHGKTSVDFEWNPEKNIFASHPSGD